MPVDGAAAFSLAKQVAAAERPGPAAEAVTTQQLLSPSTAHGASLHGENAARRQATTELLFFASVGDVNRCRKICNTWRINVSGTACARRAAAAGAGSKGLLLPAAGASLFAAAEAWQLLSISPLHLCFVHAAGRAHVLRL